MKYCLTIILLCISLLAVYAQRNTPANDLIALPEGTVYKQLPNGLHYVVKQNDIPGRKVEFRLIYVQALSYRQIMRVDWLIS